MQPAGNPQAVHYPPPPPQPSIPAYASSQVSPSSSMPMANGYHPAPPAAPHYSGGYPPASFGAASGTTGAAAGTDTSAPMMDPSQPLAAHQPAYPPPLIGYQQHQQPQPSVPAVPSLPPRSPIMVPPVPTQSLPGGYPPPNLQPPVPVPPSAAMAKSLARTSPVHPALMSNAVDQLTGQMHHLSTQYTSQSSMPQPVGIIGQRLPLHELLKEPTSPILPRLDPAYLRVTLPKVPKTAATLLKSRLPFGLTISPYPWKFQNSAEHPVPVINGPIVRCRRCRTYLNPYVEMIDQGAKWRCNLCFLDNDFPPNYDYDPQLQQYVDRASKAELQVPVYEFVAPMEYMVRPPQPPVFLFLLDVSYPAVSTGVVSAAAKIILDSLDQIPNTFGRTKIGLMTVDSTIHFYNLGANGDESKMLVVSDLEEPFVPCPDDLLVSLNESRSQIERTLGKVASVFANTQISASALGPALTAASKLIAPLGGKIVVIQAALPLVGEGKVANRQDPALLGTSKENGLLQPANNFYKSLATECSRNQICIDMFLFPQPYLDIATLGCASKFTGGKIFLYQNFSSASIEAVEKLASEMTSFLRDELGLEAVLRIRASQGVSLNAYHGSFFLRSTDLMALPNVNPRHSYSAQIVIDENINSKLLCFQTAVLHTNCHGERRIRVINAAYPVSDDPREIIAHADQGAIADLVLKMAIEKALSNKLEDARDAILNKMHDILLAIKASFQTGQNPQLLLTENLRLLPLLLLAVLKSPPIRGGNFTIPDVRAAAMALGKTLSVEETLYFLHPYMFGVHLMSNECGHPGAEDGEIVLPPPLPLGSDQLERHGLYVMDDGMDIYLWVGSQIHPELCHFIFACSFYEIRAGQVALPVLENPWSQRLHAILGALRKKHGNSPSIHVVREDSDPQLKFAFLGRLVEDKIADQPSYGAWAATLRDKLMASK